MIPANARESRGFLPALAVTMKPCGDLPEWLKGSWVDAMSGHFTCDPVKDHRMPLLATRQR
ncbi:NAD-dependent DNA ligase [Zymobacter palmae]|uniref:NAD-dependent DNA ligase n=1 Tax=Zymobacter palmae TaxID=33074 RepID=A0A348HCQ0_9GAMM|nr:NAD-dependent DNA ligase [Zymobacter palmae]